MRDIATRSDAPRFAVGIDLGTTNCSMACIDLAEGGEVRDEPIPQWIDHGLIDAPLTLPSFGYVPAEGEGLGDTSGIPWKEAVDHRFWVGVLARERGTQVPGRLVASAKSWLCHGGVDRTAAILPWHAPPDVPRVSPVTASAAYLRHLKGTWDAAHPGHLLADQSMVLTVPASFDEVARALSIDAARDAGLTNVHLVEEPLAAFYAWLSGRERSWHDHVQVGDRVLVCDIGGGTTDFSMIEIQSSESGAPVFQRVAVGEHVILGGDNLDLALAHQVERETGKLPARTWSRLVRECRAVKERFLGEYPPDEWVFHVEGSGSRMLEGGQRVTLHRAQVEACLLDGFLPFCSLSDTPARVRSGFREWGLPYAADPAITRHLAAFLCRTWEGPGAPKPPSAILLNGGFFSAPLLRQRLLDVMAAWFVSGHTAWRPNVLENSRVDLAVSRGAAYYGGVREGRGIRVGTNLARSYYIELDTDQGPVLLCVAGAAMEEGAAQELAGTPLQVTLKRPVSFPLFVSSVRTKDVGGAIRPWNNEEFTPLPPLRTVLSTGRHAQRSETPVTLNSRLNEIGTLELNLKEHPPGNRAWRLPFDVRGTTQANPSFHVEGTEQAGVLEESVVVECEALIGVAFDSKAGGKPALQRLTRELEARLGLPRLEWPLTFLRRAAQAVWEREPARRFDVVYEEKWLHWLGFCLRPGCGVALDDWRVGEVWKCQADGPVHLNRETSRIQWWIMWRRMAGGLNQGQQHMLADPLVAAWRRSLAGKGGKDKFPSWATNRPDTVEALRLLGSLEQLDVVVRMEIGKWLVDDLVRAGANAGHGAAGWALARIGAREPLYAPLNKVLPPGVVEEWITALIQVPPTPAFAFVLGLLARRIGDRFRDIDEGVRSRLLDYLPRAIEAYSHVRTLVEDGGSLNAEERQQALGDRLPRGLRLAIET